MLILERKRDQKIMIGDEIVLTVVEIRYGSALLPRPRYQFIARKSPRKSLKERGNRIE
jgi:sRNA-binding carbon storage regulator CsrA